MQRDYAIAAKSLERNMLQGVPRREGVEMVDRYPHERRLFATAVILAALFWAGLALLLEATANRYLLAVGFDYVAVSLTVFIILAYLVAYIRKARLVAYLRGNAVEISSNQHPDLHARLKAVSRRLQSSETPTAYLFQNPEIPDCFSVRFGRRRFLALNGEVIGALTDRQGAIDFVMGHELGRISDRHGRWMPFIFPSMVLPLLGPAYARAKVYSYDRHGISACKAKVDAAFALAMVASGSRRWKSFNIAQFAGQGGASSGFWMAVNELSSPMPWLSKRVAHLRAIATNSDAFIRRRNPLAYLAALFVPHLGTHPWSGFLRLLLVGLWVAVVLHTSALAYQQFAKAGVLQFVTSRFAEIRLREKPAATPTSEVANPYSRLDVDLRSLGEFARAHRTKESDIPCDFSNTATPKLNYRWERYAFSCNEPVVFTVIERGEFEPGRLSHMRSYNWQKRRLIVGPSGR
ncbi:MAG: M48 family metallopeptidase [Acidiferrobacterales bacterium]